MSNKTSNIILPILGLGTLGYFLLKSKTSSITPNNAPVTPPVTHPVNSQNNNQIMDNTNYRQCTINIFYFVSDCVKGHSPLDSNAILMAVNKYLKNATDANCYGFIQYVVYGIGSYKNDYDAVLSILDN